MNNTIGLWMLRSKSTGEAWTEDEHFVWADAQDAAVQADFCNDQKNEQACEPFDYGPCAIGFIAETPAHDEAGVRAMFFRDTPINGWVKQSDIYLAGYRAALLGERT